MSKKISYLGLGTMASGMASNLLKAGQQETEITLKIRSIFDPSSLSRRVEEYLGNFKRLVEREDAAS